MSSRRAKIAASATVLGLGGLAGAALGSNHGLPQGPVQARSGSAAIATTASGAPLPASQAVTTTEGASTRPPIVTRASGGLPGPATAEED